MAAFREALDLLPADHAETRAGASSTAATSTSSGATCRQAVADFTAARDEFARTGTSCSGPRPSTTSATPGCSRGDLVGAIQMIDEAAPVLSPLSAPYRATVEQDRAEVLTAAGRPREASRALDAAAAAYGSRRLRTYQAECELTLAWTLLREDPARARVVARRAARRFRGQASPVRALRADAAALVAEIAAGGTARRRCSTASTPWSRTCVATATTSDATVLELQGARVAVARGDLEDAADPPAPGARRRVTLR